MKKIDHYQKIEKLFQQKSAISPADLIPLGIGREYLPRMARRGMLVRVAPGVYQLPDSFASEHHELALANQQVPHGVVTLLSALNFHQLTTQLPHQVWLAVKAHARAPQIKFPSVQYVYYSGAAFTLGVETHMIEGQEVKIYSAAKTVVDCFRFRNKVGMDVALEALRQGWQERRFSLASVDQIARQCRIASVMRPYLESLGS